MRAHPEVTQQSDAQCTQICEERNALASEVASLRALLPATSSCSATNAAAASSQQLQRDLDACRSELAAMSDAHRSTLERAAHATEDLDALQSDVENMQAAQARRAAEADSVMQRLRESIASLSEELAEARAAVGDKEGRMAELVEELDACQTELAATRERVAELEAQQNKLARQISGEAAHMLRVGELEAQVAELTVAREALEQASIRLHEEAALSAARLAQVEAEAEQLRKEGIAAHEAVQEQMVNGWERQLEDKEEQLQKVHGKAAWQAAEIEQLREALQELPALQDALARTEAELRTCEANAVAEQERLKGRLSMASGALMQATAAREVATTDAEDARRLADVLREQAAAAEAEVESLGRRCQSSEAQLVVSDGSAAEVEALKLELSEAKSAAVHAAAAAGAQLAAAQEEAQTVQRQLLDLFTQLAAAREDLSLLRDQLAAKEADAETVAALREELKGVRVQAQGAEEEAVVLSARAITAETALASRGADEVTEPRVSDEAIRRVAAMLDPVRQRMAQWLLDNTSAENVPEAIDVPENPAWAHLEAVAKLTSAHCDTVCATAVQLARRDINTITTPRLPPSLPARAYPQPATSPAFSVSVDMAPLLYQQNAASSSMRPTGVVQRRDVSDGDVAPSLRASLEVAPSEGGLMSFRRVDSVPAFRQLPQRVQLIVATLDEGCNAFAKFMLAVPTARLAVMSWLVLLHVWLLASLQRHQIIGHV
jgi:chromosome segregation ATPase